MINTPTTEFSSHVDIKDKDGKKICEADYSSPTNPTLFFKNRNPLALSDFNCLLQSEKNRKAYLQIKTRKRRDLYE